MPDDANPYAASTVAPESEPAPVPAGRCPWCGGQLAAGWMRNAHGAIWFDARSSWWQRFVNLGLRLRPGLIGFLVANSRVHGQRCGGCGLVILRGPPDP